MKNAIILTWLLFSLSASLLRAETIVLTTGEYPPFNSALIKHQGLMPRIVTEAFRVEDIDVSYKFYPWKRAYQLSKHAQVQGTIQWLPSTKRAVSHYYSDPILSEQIVWFHMKTLSFSWDSLKDLKGYKICAVRGYTYNEQFYKAIDDSFLEVNFVNNNKQCLGMMLKNRIDLFPETLDVGLFQIATQYSANTVNLFTYHQKPLLTNWNYLLLPMKRQGSLRLLEKFNAGLNTMKINGTLDQYIMESRSIN